MEILRVSYQSDKICQVDIAHDILCLQSIGNGIKSPSTLVNAIHTRFNNEYEKELSVLFSKSSLNGVVTNVKLSLHNFISLRIRFQYTENFEFIESELVSLLSRFTNSINQNMDSTILEWCRSLEDQRSLRQQLQLSNGIAFICNGSILPKLDPSILNQLNSFHIVNQKLTPGNNPLEIQKELNKYVPFISPSTLEYEFILPHSGSIKGMLIPRGVNVIAGGGYHGKSTLLNALKQGIYDKYPNDPCVFVIILDRSFTIKSDEGRYVGGINISPFITSLPTQCQVNPALFSTTRASGSTSMASNVIEALELNADVFLLDEDTCATNFMIRDSRMRSLVAHEPIIPYIYRVNHLFYSCHVSSIIVIGGSGDWLDVQTCTILMDNYIPHDKTKHACSISKTFCHGRVQYNGRGLVHQLPWPYSQMKTPERYLDIYSLRNVFQIHYYVVDNDTNSIINTPSTNNAGTQHNYFPIKYSNNCTYYFSHGVESIHCSSDYRRLYLYPICEIDLSNYEVYDYTYENTISLGYHLLYLILYQVIQSTITSHTYTHNQTVSRMNIDMNDVTVSNNQNVVSDTVVSDIHTSDSNVLISNSDGNSYQSNDCTNNTMKFKDNNPRYISISSIIHTYHTYVEYLRNSYHDDFTTNNTINNDINSLELQLTTYLYMTFIQPLQSIHVHVHVYPSSSPPPHFRPYSSKQSTLSFNTQNMYSATSTTPTTTTNNNNNNNNNISTDTTTSNTININDGINIINTEDEDICNGKNKNHDNDILFTHIASSYQDIYHILFYAFNQIKGVTFIY